MAPPGIVLANRCLDGSDIIYAGHLQALIRNERARSSDLHLCRVATWHRLESLDSDTDERRVRRIWSDPSTGTIMPAYELNAVAMVSHESPFVRRDTSQCTSVHAHRAKRPHLHRKIGVWSSCGWRQGWTLMTNGCMRRATHPHNIS